MSQISIIGTSEIFNGLIKAISANKMRIYGLEKE